MIPMGFSTLARKEIMRFWKVAIQTILSPVGSNLLYLAVFGVALRERTSVFEGFDYLQFLVPGLVMLGVIQNAYANTTSSIIISKYQGTIGDLLVAPMSPWEIAAGFMVGGMVRALLVGGVTLVTALFFVRLPIPHPVTALIAALMVGGVFANIGTVVAIWARDFDHIARVSNFVITPLVFLGGVFFAASHLPPSIAPFVYLNPIFYTVDSLRFGLLGVSDLPPAASLAGIFAALVISWTISHRVWKTGWNLRV